MRRGGLRLWHLPIGVLLALCLIVLAAGSWSAAVGGPGDRPLEVVGELAAQDLVFGAVAIAMCAVAGAPLRVIGLRRTRVRWLLGVPLAGLAGFYALSFAWAQVAGDGEQETLGRLGVDQNDGYLIAAGVLTVLVAPICEEVFFRGFMHECLRGRARGVGAALVVSLIFASLHYTGPDTLVLLVPLFALSLLLCAVRLASGSLWPAVVLHGANNAIAYGSTAPRAAPLIAALCFTALLAALLALNRVRLAGHRAVMARA